MGECSFRINRVTILCMTEITRESGEAAMVSIGDMGGVDPHAYAEQMGFVILGSGLDQSSDLQERFIDYINTTTIEERIANAAAVRSCRGTKS